MKFLDLFAGIGGFRLGLEQAGHICVGYVELDKFARKSYQAIHDTQGEWTAHDIRTVESIEIPKSDIWCFGFPCQDISVAGRQKGFAGNRSSLFFTVTGLIRELEEEDRPKYLLIENVRNLLSINGGWDFAKFQIELDAIGYDCEWDVLNSKEVVPQNRERIFIVGHLRGRSTRKVFPIERNDESSVKLQRQQNSINTITARYGAENEIIRLFDARRAGLYGSQDVLSPNGISPTINTMSGGGREPKIAITTQDDCLRIRKLTPRECWRLQGFPDWAFERAEEVNSNSQLYKQAGNSVTVPVVANIAQRL